MSADDEHPFRHWINTHGDRNYQDGEVSHIVQAYQAGLVFTEDDMRAIINTNLKVMWNGDAENPLWANSNADTFQRLGKPDAYAPAGQRAGTLWMALGQLDPTVRMLCTKQVTRLRANSGRNDTIRLFFQNVTARTTPSFERRDAKGDVSIPAAYTQIPMGNVRTITMATVLPGTLVSGQKAVITCKLMQPGNLEVALYTADGKTRLATLHQGQTKGGTDGRDGILVLLFDGKDPAGGKAFPPGDYRVRWTVADDGYREYPLMIR